MNWINLSSFILGIGALIALVYKNFGTKGLSEAKTETVETLNGLVEAQRKEIDKLKDDYSILITKTEKLEQRVQELEKDNVSLREIIKAALVDYLTANPKMAVEVSKAINK